MQCGFVQPFSKVGKYDCVSILEKYLKLNEIGEFDQSNLDR